jgi:hypothetical protein
VKIFLQALVIAALLLGENRPAAATANYEYRHGEYVTIERGRSPNGRYALATHGEGELGGDNFHVWLMQGKRRLAALPGIDASNNLDTAAIAYRAAWSPDSRHVAVAWRTNRHIVQLNLHVVEAGRATLMATPDLFEKVTGRVLGEDDDMRTMVPILTWTDPQHFVVKEDRLFAVHSEVVPALLRAVGPFGRRDESTSHNELSFVNFSIVAECKLKRRHVVVIAVRPGKAPDQAK